MAHRCPATAPSRPQGQLGHMTEEGTFSLELCVLGLSITDTSLVQPSESRGASHWGSLWSKPPRTLGQPPKLPSETSWGPQGHPKPGRPVEAGK